MTHIGHSRGWIGNVVPSGTDWSGALVRFRAGENHTYPNHKRHQGHNDNLIRGFFVLLVLFVVQRRRECGLSGTTVH